MPVPGPSITRRVRSADAGEQPIANDTARAPMGTDVLLVPVTGARSKLLAAGKAVVYLLLAFLGGLLATAAAKGLFGASLLELARGGTTTGIARAVLLLLGVVVVPTAAVLGFFREPLRLSGWASGHAKRLAGRGLATGFGLLGVIAGVMWLSGAVTFRIAAPDTSAALSGLLLSAMLWLAQAAGEEGLNRGYAFVQVCRAVSFWPTAVLSSAGFMFGHIGNEGETMLGVLAAGLLGLALSYSLLKTGSLWFALGFHASWNFAQSFVFGFHNSGGTPPASLLSPTIDGSPWLTGGTTGPEGSLLIVPASIVLFAIVRRVAIPVQESPVVAGAPPAPR